MTFGKAIATCFNKYAVFEGRASRSEFWFFHIVWFLAAIVSHILAVIPASVSGPPYVDQQKLIMFFMLFMSPWYLPHLAVTVRRFHDMNISGWLYLIAFIPFLGFIIYFVAMGKGTDGPNRYGMPEYLPGSAYPPSAPTPYPPPKTNSPYAPPAPVNVPPPPKPHTVIPHPRLSSHRRHSLHGQAATTPSQKKRRPSLLQVRKRSKPTATASAWSLC